jgi:peptide/nickel transport system ATP-binding protein
MMAARHPEPDTTRTDAAVGDGYLRDEALLKVRNLEVRFRRSGRTIEAVAGISIDVVSGETLGLVGESGCGKTTTGRAILRLLPAGNSRISGSVEYGGEDLGSLSKARMRAVRRHLQMIFQDPLSSFNPRRKVWDIVGEGLAIQGVSKKETAKRTEAVLSEVGMSRAMVEGRRPHEFSGGQCQRIAIARVLALEPDLIVCDEPVASLDVSVQAQVINLLQDIRETRNLALIFISHDLAVVRSVSDRVAVMYMGKIVEIGEADLIYGRPAHPYTRTLLEAVPMPDVNVKLKPAAVGTEMPSPSRPPSGCRFRTRCPRAQEVCEAVEPLLRRMPQGQFAACHFPHDEPAPGALGMRESGPGAVGEAPPIRPTDIRESANDRYRSTA